MTIADGGMGKLDIGWLNSRSGRVERDMEAELWEKARTFLEGLEKKKSNRNGQNADGDGDENMGT
jgi:Mediator complex protein